MRKFLTVAFAFSLLFFSTPAASAHVEIVSSFPERFANVNPIPTEVWIEFSGELQTLDGQAVNTLEVIDSTGIAVNFDDPIISGTKISTKVSGQSAPGVFTVNYRVVGDDGHVIEGDYTFNASPDYSAQQTPVPINAPVEESTIPAGGILLGALILVFIGGIATRALNRRQ
jgi:methionine-rich copper-binding protein CopC